VMQYDAIRCNMMHPGGAWRRRDSRIFPRLTRRSAFDASSRTISGNCIFQFAASRGYFMDR
jgi:hypothetical protein